MPHTKRLGWFSALCALGVASLNACSEGAEGPDATSPAAGAPHSVDSAVAQLKLVHPSANVRVHGSRIRRVYGVTATGNTAAAAAEAFRQNHAPALGVEPEELVPVGLAGAAKLKTPGGVSPGGIGLMLDRASGKYKFRLYSYEQHRDGIPVFRAGLRTLVREGGDNPVVWANADLRPLGTFRPKADAKVRAVDLDESLRAVLDGGAHAGHAAPSALTGASVPTLTIFAGSDARDAAPRTAMRYTARAANGAGKWTFVADVATGDILHVESNLHYDVQGSVSAEVITGSESMDCGELGTLRLPYAEVTSPAGNTFTDAAGAFTIVESSGSTLNVTSRATGQFFEIIDQAGSTSSLSLAVTPPGPADFLHRDTQVPPELVLAQLNAYHHANALRDLLLAHVPEYPVIATQTNFPVNVNFTGLLCDQTGGAWYDNDSPVRSINFCQNNAEIANSAFGSIVHHEYGHHIIDSGQSGQAAYGEGMADTISVLFAKDPRVGVGYYRNDCDRPLRSADNDCQYDPVNCSSCGSSSYECGALISGIVWDIWQELERTEPAAADDLIRSLVFSSIPLHSGTSIEPSIAIDMLTLDDDDELIENGTPHYTEICAGFAAHGMDCPPLVDGLVIKGTDLDAEGPSDGPFEPASTSYTLHNLGPQQELAYSVTASATWLTVSSTGGTIPLGESVTVTVSIDQAQAALLDDGNYSATIQFVNESSGVGNVSREAELRVGAPVPIYTATFDDGPQGYTIDGEFQNLWHHSTACVDSLPGHTAGGSLYYGKDETCDYNTGTPILHTITSPPIRIVDPVIAELGLKYYLHTQGDPNLDHADVLVSVDDGPYQLVASNNNGGETLRETRQWEELRVELWRLLPATGPTDIRIRLAFNAVTIGANFTTGFVVDDIVVYAKVQSCASDAECNDGYFCNGVESCVEQVCVQGAPPVCDDDNVCTNDSCSEVGGCMHEPNANFCEDDGDLCTFDICDGGVCTHPDTGVCAPTGAFLERDGTVVVEAESFSENTPRSFHQWERRSLIPASGQAVMTATPNTGRVIDTNFASTSPELSFPVKFSTTGTYYVWIRGIGPTANDDSCHVGSDGSAIGSADRITGFGNGLSWTRSTMDGPSATIQVTQPGYQDLNVWMREDGLSIDKILLTTNANFWPWGNGPGESEREGLDQDPCADYCENPITFGTNDYQAGNLGTGPTCHETTAQLNGGVCGNFVGQRKLFVNGVQMPCDWSPWPSLPAASHGGYCIHTTGGNHSYASFATW